MPTVNNPSLFREMSQPFESREAASESLNAFADELTALREKYKVPNLYSIVFYNHLDTDGGEIEAMGVLSFGDSNKHEAMTAWAFGRESAQREAAIAALVAKGRAFGSKQKG